MKNLKPKHLLALGVALLGLNASFAQDRITVVDKPASSANSHYVNNRAPLAPQYMIKLPVGSVKPIGWIARQMQLQKEGLNGSLGEISMWLQKDGNAWLHKEGEWGWEELPYWLRGYSTVAYIMDDPQMLKETKTWIEGILATQRPDGYFGPETFRKIEGKQNLDLWSNMLVCWIMQSYYEYTGDQRVIPFLTNYFKWLDTYPEDQLLKHRWENVRDGDYLWTIAWLYNRTGDKFLLPLAEKIHRNSGDWTKSSELPTWHNVNIAQGFREPATYYLFSKDMKDFYASYNAHNLARNAFGQVPGGMFGADENARIGFFDPRQGTETCGFAEQMVSDQLMLQITGDPAWAENCEDVAFNSFPAAFMPDYRSLRYLTSPNMAISDSKNHRPGINNGGPFMSMNPFSNRCCQHNHGIGWPYMIEHLVMASPDNGLVVPTYASCIAKAKVGANGTEIKLTEEGNYPFEESIRFVVNTPKSVQFPLYLRIPSWCDDSQLSINGKAAGVKLTPGKYVRIDRLWNNGDRVELKVPMTIKQRVWQANKNSVSVDYGPLTLSLLIKENYEEKNSKDIAIRDSGWQDGADVSKWPAYEIYPASPWNYALVTDADITVQRRAWPADNQPFTVASSPLVFKAKGRLVPSWGIDEYGLTGVIPNEWEPRSEKVDEIMLVPMGAARLRISAFPQAE